MTHCFPFRVKDNSEKKSFTISVVVPLGETIIKKWPERANAQVLDQFQNWGGRSSTRKRISCRRMSRPIESQLIEKLKFKQKKTFLSGRAPLLKYNFHSFRYLISGMQPTFLRKWSFLVTLVDFFARESARFLWLIWGPNWPSWENDHFSSLTGGLNRSSW